MCDQSGRVGRERQPRPGDRHAEDFEAIVYDASGKELARNKSAGEEQIRGSFMLR